MKAFLSLNAREQLLVSEAAAVTIVSWLGIRLGQYALLRRTLERYAALGARTAPETDPGPTIDHVRRFVNAVAARLPSATCLVMALATHALLRRRGIPCDLRIGVRSPGRGATVIEAHAWVIREGVVVIGGGDDLHEFQPLARGTESLV